MHNYIKNFTNQAACQMRGDVSHPSGLFIAKNVFHKCLFVKILYKQNWAMIQKLEKSCWLFVEGTGLMQKVGFGLKNVFPEQHSSPFIHCSLKKNTVISFIAHTATPNWSIMYSINTNIHVLTVLLTFFLSIIKLALSLAQPFSSPYVLVTVRCHRWWKARRRWRIWSSGINGLFIFTYSNSASMLGTAHLRRFNLRRN